MIYPPWFQYSSGVFAGYHNSGNVIALLMNWASLVPDNVYAKYIPKISLVNAKNHDGFGGRYLIDIKISWVSITA